MKRNLSWYRLQPLTGRKWCIRTCAHNVSMLSQAQQKALMRKYSGSQLRSTAKRPLQRQLTAKSAAQAADPPLLQDEHPLKSATAKQRQELVSWDAAKVQNFVGIVGGSMQ